MNSENMRSTLTSKSFTDSLIRLILIGMLAVLCFRVFSPFLDLMVWGLILSIAIYPMHQTIAKRLGGRQGLGATLIVLVACPLIATPLYLLAGSFADDVRELQSTYEANELQIKQPKPEVADWPVIGERVYSSWSRAAEDLPAFLEERAEQVDKARMLIVQGARKTISSTLLFVGAFVIAGIMMAYGESGSNAVLRIFSRISGPGLGSQLQRLSVATVRSVVTGVLGVAFFQALLFGIACLMAGFPAAGLMALIVFFMGIFQLSGIFFAVPAIIYLWMTGDASAMENILLTVFFVISGLSDNVLKPLLLARGVDVPMPVILIGALGGMVAGGFVGLFIGAVVLAIGYRIFMRWIKEAEGSENESMEPC